MTRPTRLNALAAVALTSLALTGCGSKASDSATSAATKAAATSHASSTRSATASHTSTPTTGSATPSAHHSASGTATTHACTGGQTTATIGGAIKCIEVGQLCAADHAKDYTHFGFVCEDKNGRHVLAKKA